MSTSPDHRGDLVGPLLVGPDVELVLADYLRAQLAARRELEARKARVDKGVAPSDRHDWMVMVHDLGGPRLDMFRQQNAVGINIWGVDYQGTVNLARLVAALVWAAPAHLRQLIKATGPNGLSDVPEPSGQSRRYMVFVLTWQLDEI